MNSHSKFRPIPKIIILLVGFFAMLGLLWVIKTAAFDQNGVKQTTADDKSFALSLDNGDIVRGSKLIQGTATTSEMQLKLLIDGTVEQIKPVMDEKAMLTFEAAGIQAEDGYLNSVWVNDKLVHTFDKNVISFAKITVAIPADLLKAGDNKITFRSGNKISPDDNTGNHNDWRFRAVKFELGDGTVIEDPNYKTANTYTVGDGSAPTQNPPPLLKEFNFTIKEDKFHTVYYLWNTQEAAEGAHTVELVAETGSVKKAKTVSIEVDNIAPTLQIISPIEGKTYKNKVNIAVKSTDADATVVAKLDGKAIKLPAEVETSQLAAGSHNLDVTAADKVGNQGSSAVTFRVLDEMPDLPSAPSPADRSTVKSGQVSLSAHVNDSSSDPMNVAFYKAKRYDFDQPGMIDAFSNTIDREPPLVKAPAGETSLSVQDQALLMAPDGRYLVNDSKELFPYQRFSFEVGDDLLKDAEIIWVGHSLPDRLVTLYGWNYVKEIWQDLDANKGSQDFTLRGKVNPNQMVRNGRVEVLVQDRIPSSGDYDFAFVWMTDTQNYAENYPKIYDTMTQWTVDHWQEKKFNYVIHTGDIVNNWNSKIEWERASHSMKILEDAHVPYGVVAGNHDVAYDLGNYEEFWKYFGKDRFAKQPTFGGDLNNNRDHYDLISIKGNDFIILYLGWLIDQKSFDWANGILKKYANRNAIIATHEYLKPNRAYFGQGNTIWNKLVVPNPNVFMVIGGHNPGVAHNVKSIGDRSVVEMLSNYQNEPEGGEGFMRLLQFDLEHKRLLVNTYSPYLHKWNYFKPAEDEFELPITLKPIEKQVATDYIGIHVHSNELIGQTDKVPSGSSTTVSYPNLQPGQTYFWYTVAKDEFGGQSKSDVWSFQTE